MKKNNKGFSLVELIIVIAIMAILAGALAPALIKYINKSRRSTDVQNADSLRTAIQTALSNPDACDDMPANVDTTAQSAANIQTGTTSFEKEVYSVVGKATLKPKYAPKGITIADGKKTFSYTVNLATNEVKVYADLDGTYELSPSTCTEWSK